MRRIAQRTMGFGVTGLALLAGAALVAATGAASASGPGRERRMEHPRQTEPEHQQPEPGDDRGGHSIGEIGDDHGGTPDTRHDDRGGEGGGGSGGGGGNATNLPFDFSDAFLRANGIEPTRLNGRPRGVAAGSVLEAAAPDADHTRVRLTGHTAVWDTSAHPLFFTVDGVMTPASFTTDAAGQRARQIAETYIIYEFPRAANAPFSTFPKRQDAMADTSHGYFSNNPLGLWKIVHVRFTPAASTSSDGQRRLNDLAARNGRDLDGTPIIKTMSDLDSLRSRGYVSVQGVPTDGSAGPPWFMCPIPQDLRGSIAPDATLTVIRDAAGTVLPGEAGFVSEFGCLQSTGDHCN